jgi:hypothetical protein
VLSNDISDLKILDSSEDVIIVESEAMCFVQIDVINER